MNRLPYFDELKRWLQDGPPDIEQAFGRHVHWGYWPEPARADITATEYHQAAAELSLELCRLAELSHGQRVLDAGCGFGGTLQLIGEHYRDMQLNGLNIDHEQLKRARACRTSGHGSAQFVQADACRLPYADHSFDRILAVECIFHFPSRRDFFREAFRTLAPGGRLALSDFVPVPLLYPLTALIKYRPGATGFYGECDFAFTGDDYRRLADETGFRVSAESDITENTLPTYRFLRTLGIKMGFHRPSAVIETLFAEAASRSGLLRYRLLVFSKPA